MSALQESRRELMVQLEGLMKLLKVSQKRRTHVLLLPAQELPVTAPRRLFAVVPLQIPRDKQREFAKGHFLLALRVGAGGQWVFGFMCCCSG